MEGPNTSRDKRTKRKPLALVEADKWNRMLHTTRSSIDNNDIVRGAYRSTFMTKDRIEDVIKPTNLPKAL